MNNFISTYSTTWMKWTISLKAQTAKLHSRRNRHWKYNLIYSFREQISSCLGMDEGVRLPRGMRKFWKVMEMFIIVCGDAFTSVYMSKFIKLYTLKYAICYVSVYMSTLTKLLKSGPDEVKILKNLLNYTQTC